MLAQLPPPPHGKTGWPWTEESETLLPSFQPDGNPWPRFSIVTPSFNQGQFIEETIRSILLQNYWNLEYIIIDGGSSDNSQEIIRKYEQWITYWVSEKDRGQSHAINKGFEKCTGDLVNWICSDDLLCKNALCNLAPLLATNLHVFLIGKGYRVDINSRIINEINPSKIKNVRDLVDLKNHWRNSDSIMQQACVYPLEEVGKSGYLTENNHYTMDYELWGRLLSAGIPVVRTDIAVGIYRWYEGQKTSRFNIVTKILIKTALSLIINNRQFQVFTKSTLILKILIFKINYSYHDFRSKIGLKRRLKFMIHAETGNIYK